MLILFIIWSSKGFLCVFYEHYTSSTTGWGQDYTWQFRSGHLPQHYSLYRRIFVYIFCLISIRALVSYWEIQWSAVNNDRVLKDKFCQKIWVQYIKCILRNACLKTRIFTTVGLEATSHNTGALFGFSRQPKKFNISHNNAYKNGELDSFGKKWEIILILLNKS